MSNVFSSVVWSRLMYEKVQRKFLENSIKICLKFDQIIFQGSNQVGWRGRVVVELELRLTIIRFTFGFVYIRIYICIYVLEHHEIFMREFQWLTIRGPSCPQPIPIFTHLPAYLTLIDSMKKLQTKKWWKVVLCCMRTQSFTCQEVGEEQKLRRGRRAGQEPDV